MLYNKEFKEFSDSISGVDKYDEDIVNYCRYKFAAIRSNMSRRNVKIIYKLFNFQIHL